MLRRNCIDAQNEKEKLQEQLAELTGSIKRDKLDDNAQIKSLEKQNANLKSALEAAQKELQMADKASSNEKGASSEAKM